MVFKNIFFVTTMAALTLGASHADSLASDIAATSTLDVTMVISLK